MITQGEYTKTARKNAKKNAYKKKMKQVESLNKKEIFSVGKVDEQGFIDLSKFEVTAEHVKMVEAKYEKGCFVQSLMISLSEKLKLSMEDLYNMIIFPLQKKGDHAYDLFHKNIFDLDKIIEPLQISDANIKERLIEVIQKRCMPSPEKVKAIFELKTLSKDGILDLKSILTEAMKFSSDEFKLQILLESTPYYAVQTVTPNKPGAIKLIEECLAFIEEKVKALKGGKYELKTFNKSDEDTQNEYAALLQLDIHEDKQSYVEEDNDEDMGIAEEINFDEKIDPK